MWINITMTKKNFFDVLEIQQMIPHRYPFLMIDKVVDVVKAEGAIGIKNVTINEPYFVGHFPLKPVMPGVLIVEAMAQTAGVVVVHTLGDEGKGKLVYFMTIDNCKFRRPVVPGDQLKIHVKVVQFRKNVWKFSGEAYVDETLVAQADYSAMIFDPE
jgi:3-hydroxyacyl-[acyl-carrier-protein] dehydratase